jgi:hypothetical protein
VLVLGLPALEMPSRLPRSCALLCSRTPGRTLLAYHLKRPAGAKNVSRSLTRPALNAPKNPSSRALVDLAVQADGTPTGSSSGWPTAVAGVSRLSADRSAGLSPRQPAMASASTSPASNRRIATSTGVRHRPDHPGTTANRGRFRLLLVTAGTP